MIEDLVKAVLYEGYALYPYRPSALKNQKRFAFGMLYPRAYAERHQEPWLARVEVLATDAGASETRFLRMLRGGGATEHSMSESGRIGELHIEIEQSIEQLSDGLQKICVEVRNVTPIDSDDREDAVDLAMASAHVILRFTDAEPLSAIDPPPHAITATAACRCVGLYPVLVGDRTVLASPIILPDHPKLAPTSPGDFFDGTEIDEMLTLRILTMTDAEKREASADPRIAAMIARTEQLGIENTARLHGSVATSWPRTGTKVRLKPAGRADAFDVILRDKLATVASVERDLDGKVHCAVTIDEDPGAHEPIGHRFYFSPDELEVIA
jgi:hypothetical protein